MARIRVQQIQVPAEPVQDSSAAAPVVQKPEYLNVQADQPSNSPQQAHLAAHPRQGVFLSRVQLFWAIAAILVVVGLLFSYYERERPATQAALGASQTLPGATTEAQQYYDKISAYIDLPSDEAPTVLNVSDADEVKKDNAAFTDIKNGDKMLFFTKSRKLVVYRPSTEKVIAVVSLATPESPSRP